VRDSCRRSEGGGPFAAVISFFVSVYLRAVESFHAPSLAPSGLIRRASTVLTSANAKTGLPLGASKHLATDVR